MTDKIRYDQIFEHSSEGLLVSNERGIIEAVNPRLIAMFGYESESQILGQKIEILVPDNVGAHHVQLRNEYAIHPSKRMMGGDSKLRAKRKDGSEFPVEISLSYYKAETGTKVIAFVVDIGRRAKAEEELNKLNQHLELEVEERTRELHEQNKLLRSVAKNFPNGNIYVLKDQCQIVWADGQLLRDTGLTDQSLIGVSFINRLPDELKAEVGEALTKVFQGEIIESEIVNKDRYYSLFGVPIGTSNENVERIMLVEMDITTSKKMELEMIRNLQKEKELNEMKSRFVSMASHEFRTPLSSILSSATLIGKYQEGDQQNKRDKHIDRIKSSVANLMDILGDFLSIDKLEEGKTGIHIEPVNINELSNEILEEVSVLTKAGQQINYSHFGEEKELRSDKKLLKNIVLNLISNAGKYSEENTTIEFKTRLQDGILRIEVQDQGIGIPEEEQGQLFTRFFRAQNATNIQGTGLGLSIVKKYVELLKGTIRFESNEGEGSIFVVVLPKSK
ncbi:MAG: PAS domain S-box protein [Flavobacteriales bacterium]|jgi:PAS domain S-box-containing protein|nr:PAS domain S-box protein [Flavobacteriales bacterium]